MLTTNRHVINYLQDRTTPIFIFYKMCIKRGRPNFCLWIPTMEHGLFRSFFNVFESSTTNHRRQKCACVISFQMKTATMQHNFSCKCLHCRHGVFQTSFIDSYADLQINSFDLLSKFNTIWPKFIGQERFLEAFQKKFFLKK